MFGSNKSCLYCLGQLFSKKIINYVDTVVGLKHSIQPDLLTRTIQEVSKSNSNRMEISKLKKEFGDPIIAIQDLDLELPYPVETAFYSVFNLLELKPKLKYTASGDSYPYLIVNQAIDSISYSKIKTEKEIKNILACY